MCQYVRKRCANRKHGQRGQDHVPVHLLGAGCASTFEPHGPGFGGKRHKHLERGQHRAGQELSTHDEDPRALGKPWHCVVLPQGHPSDLEGNRTGLESCEGDHGFQSALRFEETRTPAGVQPGHGFGRSAQCQRPQSGRLQDGLHPATWTPGGTASARCQGSFLSRPFSPGFKVFFLCPI